MAKYLVTGAAGFIASKTAELLLDRGDEVVGVDNLNEYYDVRLKSYRLEALEKREGMVFEKLDIEERDSVRDLFRRHDFSGIFNLAARAGVRYSMEDPEAYMTTNAMGTLNLLNCMKAAGVKKMVLASTSSLYSGQEIPFKETLPVNTPISPYAASKKAAEVMAYSYHHLYDLNISVVRYFTVFGPAGRPDMAIFRFIQWIKDGVPIELFGDGSQSRDFTYVEDIARGTIVALERFGFEIFNLGGGKNPMSMNTIIDCLAQLLGKEAIVERKSVHRADIKETRADIAKAKRFLKWEPQVSVEEGLELTVAWHRENAAWLKDIRLDEGGVQRTEAH
ncbi:MAG: UDP-glucose 4-epimerase [Verrucomicrobia subdivision 3 bacterium]|nr:UDP-glucose 4-epimerase [Limisphaerales bacterium]MCS1415851.1 UDP-glucose 4-epimerase [Limisphaerales bacterium]